MIEDSIAELYNTKDTQLKGTILELVVFEYLKKRFGKVIRCSHLDYNVENTNTYIEIKHNPRGISEEQAIFIYNKVDELFIVYPDKVSYKKPKDKTEKFETIIGTMCICKVDKIKFLIDCRFSIALIKQKTYNDYMLGKQADKIALEVAFE